MIAAGLGLWTLISLAVGIVIGKAIAMADRQDEAHSEGARREVGQHCIGAPRVWSA